MKIERFDGGDERRVLVGLATDDRVLGALASKWKHDMLLSRYANIVVGWCVDYFLKYDRAPREDLPALFQSWAHTAKDQETIDLVESFLSSLEGDYEQLRQQSNPEYLIDLTARHLNDVKGIRLADQLKGHILAGKREDAKALLAKFDWLDMGAEGGTSVLHDKQAIREALNPAAHEPIITYPGDLGRFFSARDALCRDCFVAFMGPKGRGKTWWLIDIAWTAMLQRRRVAFFEVGDMSRNQVMARFMVRAAQRPTRARSVTYPVSLSREEEEKPPVLITRERVFKRALSYKRAWAACEEILDTKIKSKHSFLELSTHSAGSVSVRGMRDVLRQWERKGWTPDVVVVDYADLLAPIDHREEGRDRIDSTWRALRALSTELHCLVVTATQTAARSYNAELITRTHFADDRRKIDHVNGMVGLSQTEQEKKQGLTRLNWVALREEDFLESRCVTVAGCLALASPAILSVY